jgi:hypothetical protein
MGLKGYRLWVMGQLDSTCRAPPSDDVARRSKPSEVSGLASSSIPAPRRMRRNAGCATHSWRAAGLLCAGTASTASQSRVGAPRKTNFITAR